MPKLLIIGGIVLGGMIAAWFLWMAPLLNRGRNQQEAVKRIKGVDAVQTTWNGSVWGVRATGIGDVQLKELAQAKLPELILLQVTKSNLTDEAFAEFAKLNRLQELNLLGTPVSDGALQRLAALKHLKRLNLTNTGVEFKQVDELQKSLKDTKITY